MPPLEPDPRPSGAAIVLMLLVLLWSGGLAVGFGYAAVTGSDQLGSVQFGGFLLAAFFCGLLALRTALELVRRLRR